MKKSFLLLILLTTMSLAFFGCKKDADDTQTIKATLFLCEDTTNNKNICYWLANGKYATISITNEEMRIAKLDDETYVNAIGYIENDYSILTEETCPVYSCYDTKYKQTYYALSEKINGKNDTYTLVPDLKCKKMEFHFYDCNEEDTGVIDGYGLFFELNGATYIVREGEPVADWEIHPTRKINVTITLDENCPQIIANDITTTIGYTELEGRKYYVANMFAE